MASHTLDVDDLFLFLRAAECIDRGLGLREVAKHLKISTSSVSLLLSRIEQQFPGQQLFTRAAGAGGRTSLTETGKRCIGNVIDQFKQLRKDASRFYIACSLSLLTNDVMGPVVAHFMSSSDSKDVRFGLRLKTELRFGELIRQIQNREIDLAIVWGVTERIKRHPTDVKISRIDESPFDLVFVSYDPNLIDKINGSIDEIDRETASPRSITVSNESRLSDSSDKLVRQLEPLLNDRRCALLSGDAQSLPEFFPNPDSLLGHECVQVDTFDAAIAVIRAKAADIALLPAFYSQLLRLKEQNQVFFSKPVGTIPVVYIHSHPGVLNSFAETLIDGLRRQLVIATKTPTDLIRVDNELPLKLNEYRKLRYAYYIDVARTAGVSNAPIAWRWEVIEWGEESNKVLFGTITNVEGDSFAIKAQRVFSAFVIEAMPASKRPDGSVAGFISTFTVRFKFPLRLFGTWTGIDGSAAVNYATIVSEDRLELESLVVLQHAVSFRSFLSTDDGVRFDRQP